MAREVIIFRETGIGATVASSGDSGGNLIAPTFQSLFGFVSLKNKIPKFELNLDSKSVTTNFGWKGWLGIENDSQTAELVIVSLPSIASATRILLFTGGEGLLNIVSNVLSMRSTVAPESIMLVIEKTLSRFTVG